MSFFEINLVLTNLQVAEISINIARKNKARKKEGHSR